MAVTKDSIASDLRDWVEQHRNFSGPKDLATATGLSANIVGKYMRGKNLPPPDKARALYRVTGLPSLRELAGAEQPALGEETTSQHTPANSPLPEDRPASPEHGDSADASLPATSRGLTESRCKKLLARVDVVRDPIHGDIRLTALERRLVDTRAFQRLRHLSQLGLTSLVYPGAVHTRFAHSLGVLHVSSEIIAICNSNAETYGSIATESDPVPLRITSYGELLARLCALLHDLAHIPFGHSFEKEGRIIEDDEWNDPSRAEILLGNDSEVADCIRAAFSEHDLPREEADIVRNRIKNVLRTNRKAVSHLPLPFVHDIVGNTICADLLDYVRRDMYYCGLSESTGDRFLRYLAVLPVIVPEGAADDLDQHLRNTGGIVSIKKGDSDKEVFETRRDGQNLVGCRVVLLQYRYNERHLPVTKNDVRAEAIDLVRRRLNVAEKAYFHRTKMVATAMLVSAVHDHGFKVDELLDLSDLEVLKAIARSSNLRAKRLGEALAERRLYKCIYRASYRPSDESASSERVRQAYRKFKKPKERRELEDLIEIVLGLRQRSDPDAVVGCACVSCPDERMNVKEFDMLVLPDPISPIRRLQDSSDPPTKAAINAIHKKHEHLWKIEVYVDPHVVEVTPTDPLARDLAGAIQAKIGPRNEVPGMEVSSSKSFEDLIAEEEVRVFLVREGVNPSTIAVGHERELRHLAMRAPSRKSERQAREGAMREKLGEWGYRG